MITPVAVLSPAYWRPTLWMWRQHLERLHGPAKARDRWGVLRLRVGLTPDGGRELCRELDCFLGQLGRPTGGDAWEGWRIVVADARLALLVNPWARRALVAALLGRRT